MNYFLMGAVCVSLITSTKLHAESLIHARNEEEVKREVMKRALMPASYLAHYLGYGWVSGCGFDNVGEGYLMTNEGFRPDQSRGCEGYKANHRTSMVFGDWRYAVKAIHFGTPVLNQLEPIEIDYIVFDNWWGELEQEVGHSFRVLTSKTLTERRGETFNWRLETSFSHNQQVPLIAETEFSHTFEFGGEVKKENEVSIVEETETALDARLKLPAYSRRRVSVNANRAKSTVDYTAVIEARFSMTFDGFLRWGGGYTAESNYHRDYHGSTGRPTVRYTFGSPQISMVEDLKRQITYREYPWDWQRLLSDHENARWAVDSLTNESVFTFPIKGELSMIDGRYVEIKYHPIELNPAAPHKI